MEETLNNNNNNNKGVVEALYKALACHDTSTLSTLLATDLEWWFHGPPHREHMMRVLTAGNHDDDQWSSWFEFKPRSITAIDEERVIVEGWEGARSSYWVHVWTVRDGRLTQLREYFNTWLTVRDLRSVHVNISRQVREINNANGNGNGGISVNYSDNNTVWQSEGLEYLTRSMPGLVLAI